MSVGDITLGKQGHPAEVVAAVGGQFPDGLVAEMCSEGAIVVADADMIEVGFGPRQPTYGVAGENEALDFRFSAHPSFKGYTVTHVRIIAREAREAKG